MSSAEAIATASIVEKTIGLDFWCQFASFDIDTYVKQGEEKGQQNPPSKSFQSLPIDPQLAAELRPYNGFYNFFLISSGPQFPISPFPGPGPVFDKGFMMIDQSVKYSPQARPSHEICITFKFNFLTFVKDITSQIILPGGFNPTTHKMTWSERSNYAQFTNMKLTSHNSFVATAQGIFDEVPMIGGNQLAPASLDVFVGNYQHVIGGAPPCTFSITKTPDGFQCTVKQLHTSGSQSEIVASTISYNAQMYLLTVHEDKNLQGFSVMLGTFGPVGLVAYVMAKAGNATGFIGINEKPNGHHDADRLENSALWSRMLMHNADPGAKMKVKKVEAAKKTHPPTGVPVLPEVASGMHPFNGFYSLTGNDLKDGTNNWLLIDRQVTYYSLKSSQKGVPQYKLQVTYQVNGCKVTDISEEATTHFDPRTNSIKFGETELNFSSSPLSQDQSNASQLEGQIKTCEGQIVHVTGTNSLTAPVVSMYAGNYCYILKHPSKGPSYSLNLYYNNDAKQGTFEISITNEKTKKSTVLPYFTYDPAMFTVDIPAYPKQDIPKMLVMLGTVAPFGCVAYIIIRGKKPHESQITFISTNL